MAVLTTNHGYQDFLLQPEWQGEEKIPVYRRLRLYMPFDQPARLARWKRWRTRRYNFGVTRQMIDQLRPDIVFIWSQLRLTLGAARAAELSGVPVAYTLNDEHLTGYLPVPFAWGIRSVIGFVLDHTLSHFLSVKNLRLRHVTCISRRLKENLLQQGIPIQEAKVIYQAIPLEQFPLKHDPGRMGKPVRLLFVGQLHRDKGPQTLIAAAGLLAEKYGPDFVHVSIVGEGPFRAALEQQAAQLSAAVTFHGRVPHVQISSFCQDHDLFVFPSIWDEPFGLTPLEAMASGTPVISTTQGGHGEFIVHDLNALTIKPDNPDELAQRILALIEDEPLRRRLAVTARQMVQEGFSFQRYSTELETFLLQAVKEGP